MGGFCLGQLCHSLTSIKPAVQAGATSLLLCKYSKGALLPLAGTSSTLSCVFAMVRCARVDFPHTCSLQVTLQETCNKVLWSFVIPWSQKRKNFFLYIKKWILAFFFLDLMLPLMSFSFIKSFLLLLILFIAATGHMEAITV